MNINSAKVGDRSLEVTIDGKIFEAGEKYTIIELGYAIYLMDEEDEDWLMKNGDFIPTDLSDGRSEMLSRKTTLVTAHPVLVALAYQYWWSQNGKPEPKNKIFPIPTFEEAVEIVRNREIINEFNQNYEGLVPGLDLYSKNGKRLEYSKTMYLIHEKTLEESTNFKTDLIQRYWYYQRSQFPDWEKHFEKPFAQNLRPPVFLISQSTKNILINRDASQQEKDKLLDFVPKGEHHKWFRSMNSSQALSQSILGNLAVYGFLNELSDLKDDDGLDLFGKAEITNDNFCMEHKIKYLGEPHSTSLDGYISGDYKVAIECKFTETKIGTCSRPRLEQSASNYNAEFCNGNYEVQLLRTARCSLSEIGVKYWHYLPELFKWNSDKDLLPCPLNKNYQLVRNILATGVKPDGTVSIHDGNVLLIYDKRNPAFQIGGIGWNAYLEVKTALINPSMLRKCSWQRIVRRMREGNILSWLTTQLEMKYGL